MDSLRRELIVRAGNDPEDQNEYRLYSPAATEQIQQAEAEGGRPYSV